ncbi:SIR2 family protein [Flavobacterium sp.]|uniref:SIR2 family protein n=1 Tax=Flavobacterium sp. TaxID=239 RepID=UPI0040341F71
MGRKYLYINGQKSVEIEEGEGGVNAVYIDGKLHDFGGEENPDKIAFAHATKRKKYSSFLNSQFENLVILTGAGSSVGIGDNIVTGEITEERKGRLLIDLWDDVELQLTKQVMDRFCVLVRYEDKNEETNQYIKNLEKLLSLANISKNYVKDSEEDNPLDIDDIIKKIEKLIQQKCTLILPNDAPHSIFIERVTKRKVTLPRVKIFTLNYDTLFEQAGRKKNFTIIDGFSFSHPRTFSGRNFDLDVVSRNSSRVKEEDNFVQKVFHLYKPHGSVDWTRNGNDIVQKDWVEKPLMIFPKDSKYESSYEQPYFEMMSRFQQYLRGENVLLICIGFKFNDKHIVTSIIEALEQNPGFQLVVVNRTIDESPGNFNNVFEASKKHNNIVLISELFEDFAINFPDLKSYNQEDLKKINLSNQNEQQSL